MNSVFTEHAVNNTNNNEKPKTTKKCLQQNKTGIIPESIALKIVRQKDEKNKKVKKKKKDFQENK